MRAVFLGKELIGIVDGCEVKPAVACLEQLAWIKRDNQGISLLCQELDKKYLQHVISCTTSMRYGQSSSTFTSKMLVKVSMPCNKSFTSACWERTRV
jgi:hypothetical protein